MHMSRTYGPSPHEATREMERCLATEYIEETATIVCLLDARHVFGVSRSDINSPHGAGAGWGLRKSGPPVPPNDETPAKIDVRSRSLAGPSGKKIAKVYKKERRR